MTAPGPAARSDTAAGSDAAGTPAAPLDPFDPALLADPFPAYRALRADPEIRRSTIGTWPVTRIADVRPIIRDSAGLMQPPGQDVADIFGDGPAARIHRGLMVLSDPPMHTRLRKLAERALTRRAVENLRGSVESVVDAALDRLQPGAEFDGVRELAYVVPYEVICGMLGVPDADRDRVLEQTPDFFRIFLAAANDADGVAACNRACAFFLDYLGEQIAYRRAHPGDDLFTALIQAEAEGDRLSRDELSATVLALLTGGFDTTMGVLSAGLQALADPDGGPARLAALRSDPERVAVLAAEELMRWESPVQVSFRHFIEDRGVGDTVVPAGEPIWLMLAAANRDESEFADPDRVDFGRVDNRHVAFGGNRHLCIGNHLARLEVVVALRAVARRWTALEPAGPAVRRPGLQFRSLDHLPLRLTGTAD